MLFNNDIKLVVNTFDFPQNIFADYYIYEGNPINPATPQQFIEEPVVIFRGKTFIGTEPTKVFNISNIVEQRKWAYKDLTTLQGRINLMNVYWIKLVYNNQEIESRTREIVWFYNQYPNKKDEMIAIPLSYTSYFTQQLPLLAPLIQGNHYNESAIMLPHLPYIKREQGPNRSLGIDVSTKTIPFIYPLVGACSVDYHNDTFQLETVGNLQSSQLITLNEYAPTFISTIPLNTIGTYQYVDERWEEIDKTYDLSNYLGTAWIEDDSPYAEYKYFVNPSIGGQGYDRLDIYLKYRNERFMILEDLEITSSPENYYTETNNAEEWLKTRMFGVVIVFKVYKSLNIYDYSEITFPDIIEGTGWTSLTYYLYGDNNGVHLALNVFNTRYAYYGFNPEITKLVSKKVTYKPAIQSLTVDSIGGIYTEEIDSTGSDYYKFSVNDPRNNYFNFNLEAQLNGETVDTWSIFPVSTTDNGLREIPNNIQEEIRDLLSRGEADSVLLTIKCSHIGLEDQEIKFSSANFLVNPQYYIKFRNYITETNGYIQFKILKCDVSVQQDVAYLDVCPAKYYLLWQDRAGGFQCQRFNKQETFKESIERVEFENYDKSKRLGGVSIQPSWIINSDWVEDKYMPYYESILVSPYIELWDIENREVYKVYVEKNSYTEKNFNNQGRSLFNIQLEVKLLKPQQILY